VEPANILTTGINLPLSEVNGDQNGMRLGVQELVRWGIGPSEMPIVARFLARVLFRNEDRSRVREDVVALRARFQDNNFVGERDLY
jgi:glycine hydroxymethyltransferase